MDYMNLGVSKSYKFGIATEDNKAEKFDDLVFACMDVKGNRSWRFVQAKHKQDGKKKILRKELFTKQDDDPFQVKN